MSINYLCPCSTTECTISESRLDHHNTKWIHDALTKQLEVEQLQLSCPSHHHVRTGRYLVCSGHSQKTKNWIAPLVTPCLLGMQQCETRCGKTCMMVGVWEVVCELGPWRRGCMRAAHDAVFEMNCVRRDVWDELCETSCVRLVV